MLSRRQFVGAGALATLSTSRSAAAATTWSALRLEFEADLESLSTVTPTPLTPSEPGRVVVEFRRRPVGSECRLSIAVEHKGEEYLLPLAIWDSDARALRTNREHWRLPAFPGDIVREGGEFRLAVGGVTLFAAASSDEPELTQGPTDLPALTYRYLLHPEWPKGLLDPSAPVELWRVSPPADSPWQSIAPEAVSTSGNFDGTLARLGAAQLRSAAVLRESPVGEGLSGKFLETVAASKFAPFALRRYQSDMAPIARTTTFPAQPLRAAEIEAYRGRGEFAVEGVTIVEVEATIDREKHAALLPPGCRPVLRPSLRLLAIRSFDDPSIDEAWLLAFCLLENRAVWYAVAHLKPSLSGTEFGREVFGYPTKSGQVDSFVTPAGFGATLRRNGRALLHAEGSFEGFSTGTSLAQIEIGTLRLRPEFAGSPRSGELLIQPWYYQGLRKRVAPRSLKFDFPIPPDGSKNTHMDAWHHFGPTRITSVSVIDSGALQRMPAQVVAGVEDIDTYYQDRCDGRLPWEPPQSTAKTRRT